MPLTQKNVFVCCGNHLLKAGKVFMNIHGQQQLVFLWCYLYPRSLCEVRSQSRYSQEVIKLLCGYENADQVYMKTQKGRGAS